MPKQSVNHWPQRVCAKAYWSQHELPSYQELLSDTAAWLEPKPGETWLDLGCGGGQLTKTLWRESSGKVARIVGMDYAAINREAYRRLQQSLAPRPAPNQITFRAAEFLSGLRELESDSFDGVVSGLAIQYADSFSNEKQQWTTERYEQVLAEIQRTLRSGGRLVFSVNVPNPSWRRVGWDSFNAILKTQNPVKFLINGLLMWRYGNWVKHEAARGRFHYLPIETVIKKLQDAGFHRIEHKVTYSEQAYLVRCWKP